MYSHSLPCPPLRLLQFTDSTHAFLSHLFAWIVTPLTKCCPQSMKIEGRLVSELLLHHDLMKRFVTVVRRSEGTPHHLESDGPWKGHLPGWNEFLDVRSFVTTFCTSREGGLSSVEEGDEDSDRFSGVRASVRSNPSVFASHGRKG